LGWPGMVTPPWISARPAIAQTDVQKTIGTKTNTATIMISKRLGNAAQGASCAEERMS